MTNVPAANSEVLVPPLIIDQVDGAGLLFYRSRKTAEGDLEAIDVDNGEYVGWDSEGRLLDLGVTKAKVRRLFGWSTVESVRIVAAEHMPSHQGELRERLVHSLQRHGVDKRELEGLDLCELVMKALLQGDLT